MAQMLRDVLRSDGRQSFFILPTQTWFSSGFQRPQQLAKALAELGHPVAFCEPWRSYKVLLTKETERKRRFTGLREIAPRLWLLRCPPAMLTEMIEQGHPDAILMNWPNQAHFVGESPSSLVIYDVIDDHSLIPQVDDKWRCTHEHWVRHANVLAATADDLIAQLKPMRLDVLLLPNGVRLEDWTRSGKVGCPLDLVPARKANMVVSYYGALGEWFDWDMWLGAAALRPDWAFVLIGYPYDGKMDAVRARLVAFPNAHYLGPKPYQELPAYLAQIDVATIPFILNDITHGCSPVKLFEYMAAGKPIVCSPMREVLKYRSVRFATTAEEFVRRIEEVAPLRADPEYQYLLRQEAAENTWRARAERLSVAVAAARSSVAASQRPSILHPVGLSESPF